MNGPYRVRRKNSEQQEAKYNVERLVPINLRVENCKKKLVKAKSLSKLGDISDAQLKIISDKAHINLKLEENVNFNLNSFLRERLNNIFF